MKKTVGGATTYYVGSWFEVTQAGAVTKYYYFGARRVAMKQGSVVTYLHSDHLGSTSVASNASGALVSRQTYFPYGAPRTSDGALPTDYTFTGQRADASAGLMYYNARYYDAALGRFTQPDLLIPNLYNPQALNRYAYVYNNPLKYTDPTGHCPYCLTVAIGTAVDVAFDFFIAQATGTSFNFGESVALNLGINAATAGIGSKIAKGGKIAGLVAKYGDNIGKAGARVISERQLEILLKEGMQNKDAKEAVIGLFRDGRGYTGVGGQTGRTYLGLEQWKFDALIEAGYDWWQVNQAFLDAQIAAGKAFLLETSYEEALEAAKKGFGTNFLREINYLLDNGYRFSRDGTRLIPGGSLWDVDLFEIW